MNNYLLDFSQLNKHLEKGKNFLILIPSNPSLDSVAAGLALYLSFKKNNSQILIASPSAMTVAYNHLIAVDKITNQIGNRNLVISFDYVNDSIEKVSYNIQNNKFNLVIEPRVGQPTLNPEKVSYSYSGCDADLIFIIGALKLEDLDYLYFNEKKLFEKSQTVNIDYRLQNTKFGKINLVDIQAASCSEIICNLIRTVNLPVDQDIASNLLAGIEANTANFQANNTSPSSFEAASWCLQNKAQRRKNTQQASIIGQSPIPPFNLQPFSFNQPVNLPQQTNITSPLNTNINNNNASFSNIPTPKTENIPQEPTFTPNINQQPPPDWLKPKIYKGNSVI